MSEVRRPDCAVKPAQSRLVALIVLAFAAGSAHAAVPVEESVEESRDATTTQRTVRGAGDGARDTRRRDSRRVPDLTIPPTIEPSVNTDTRPVNGWSQTSGQATDRAPGAYPVAADSNQPTRFETGTSGAAPANDENRLRDLFYQLQVLQQEVQNLRGTVEEQQHLIRRLQKDQKDQYLDLDSRMLALRENRPQPGPGTAATNSPSQPALAGANVSEKEAYRTAFEAMRASRFDESAASFQQLIENFPNGQYTPNAFYWMGEIFLVADSDVEQARQSFMQVVNLYPDHQKTPDALYKLGVVYHTLGDVDAALRYLSRVQSEHPTSSAAGLARKFAEEIR